LLLLSNFQYLI